MSEPTSSLPSASLPPTPSDAAQFETWRSSLASIFASGSKPSSALSSSSTPAPPASDEGSKREYKEWMACEGFKTAVAASDPDILTMLTHLRLSGCPTDTRSSVHCAPCGRKKQGGFSPTHGIMLCQEIMTSKKATKETMLHEMIHLYDHCRFNVDWSNLRHHACSEIRAANLSGDCAYTNEVRRGYLTARDGQAKCVRRRAILSVLMNPKCPSQEAAANAVDDVWESCMADIRPFEKVKK